MLFLMVQGLLLSACPKDTGCQLDHRSENEVCSKNTAGFTWPLLIAYPTDHNEADDQEPSEEDLAHVDKVLIQTSSLDP